MILGYPSIATPELFKEWKAAINSVEQGYESMERCQDYKTEIGTTYSGQGQPMDIGKSNNNFKDGKPKCFNCNKYGHIAKECWKKKEKNTRKCFKCDREGYIVKNCKGKQSMKKQNIQEKSDNEEGNKEEKKKQSFGENLEQA